MSQAHHGKAVSGIKAVKIVTANKDTPHLKLDRLETILRNHQDHPVAIISVFGEHRTGKSFLLNFLCQYLRENQSPSWYKKNYVKLINTFHWKGGVERDTIGIYMTDKPFMLKNDKGQDTAVFFMDTQGSFHKQVTAGESSLMFALSSLLSSVQIYNLPSAMIRENDLQHLEVFTHYAQAAIDYEGDEGSQHSSLFQSLLFLVRNWQMSDYHYGSKGGMDYMKEVMKTEKAENDSVRRQIKQSFSDVRCHLLPHPGVKVTKHKDSSRSSIKLADIEEDFLDGVDDLAKCLFSKNKLVVKKFDGETCTGEVILKLASEFKEKLESSSMPKVNTFLKNNEIVEFCQRIQEFEEDYKTSIEAEVGEKYVEPLELVNFHEECFVKALSKYKAEQVLSDGENVVSEDLMKKCLAVAFKAMVHENNARKEKKRIVIMDKAIAAGNVYKQEMKRIAGGKYLEDVSEAKQEAKTKAHEAFKTFTSNYNKDLVKKCLKDLDNVIESKQKQFERKNAKQLEVLDADLSKLVAETTMYYAELMKKAIEEDSKEDLNSLYDTNLQISIDRFMDNEIGQELQCKTEKLKSLKNKIREHFKTLKQETEDEHKPKKIERKNYLLQENELQRLRTKRRQLASKYSSSFKHLKEKYVDDEEVYQIQRKAKQQALKAYADIENDVSTECVDIYWENKDTLQQEIEQFFNQVKENNLKNKVNIERSLNPFYEELSADYLRTMNKASRNASVATLETLHVAFISSVHEELNKAIPYENIQQIAIATCEGMLREQQDEVNNGKKIWKELMDQVSAGASASVGFRQQFNQHGMRYDKLSGEKGDSTLMETTLANFNVNISKLPCIQYLKTLNF